MQLHVQEKTPKPAHMTAPGCATLPQQGIAAVPAQNGNQGQDKQATPVSEASGSQVW